MSLTYALTGTSSQLSCDYFPPIELAGEYECGLVDLQTYNSIPNIDEGNNLFHIGSEIIEIPIGSYELDDIADYINKKMKNNDDNVIVLFANNNTLKSELIANAKVYFNKDCSIGSLLGFSKRILEPHIRHSSDLPVNITRVSAIRVECNIIEGSYSNSIKSHILHEFSPMVEPGYKIVEVPKNVIYLPLNTRAISTLTIRIVDQNGDLINFRGEQITIRLHLRRQHAGI